MKEMRPPPKQKSYNLKNRHGSYYLVYINLLIGYTALLIDEDRTRIAIQLLLIKEMQ